jgi:hypothetical protein
MASILGRVAVVWLLLITLSYLPRVHGDPHGPDPQQLADAFQKSADAWPHWCTASVASPDGPAVRERDLSSSLLSLPSLPLGLPTAFYIE